MCSLYTLASCFQKPRSNSCESSCLKARQQEKRRKRVTKLVAAVVILFALLWLPIHVLNLWLKLDPYFPRTRITLLMKILAHTLSYANSCVNPFVYAFMSDGFRKAFRKTCPSLAKACGMCEGPSEECGVQVGLVDKTEHTKCTITTASNNGQLMQTDLWIIS